MFRNNWTVKWTVKFWSSVICLPWGWKTSQKLGQIFVVRNMYILCTNDFSVIISFYRTKMHISLFIKTHWFQKTQIQVYLIVTLRDKSKVVYTFWAILAVRQYRRRAYTAVFVRSVFSDTVLITLTLRNAYIQYHSTYEVSRRWILTWCFTL